ncbi:hypothetical protein C9374_006376 [Naegleria lovaniensis]|uniref:Uncharacterized protein n=1 Tax=Naegleria lovaniensis TaxID=51637 RepID=A0AA88GMZ7_NAELO|nr:uncharacterized protein C9374_006376 [Naegleria lovaniensis]KAG2381387.1 hypothetical protein C9374_006376 [Naegleria lovaniensis]
MPLLPHVSLVGNSYSSSSLPSPPSMMHHLVTATYLDPKKYSTFINIWIYLGILYGVQYLQYLYLNSKSKKWKLKLQHWSNLIKKYKSGELQHYEYSSFKYDLLPQSVYNTLLIFSKAYLEGRISEDDQEKSSLKLPPNVLLGASFINSLENVIFENMNTTSVNTNIHNVHMNNHTMNASHLNTSMDEKYQKVLSVITPIDETLQEGNSSSEQHVTTVSDSMNTSSFETMAQYATQTIMDKYEQLLEHTEYSYQHYYAHQLPPWKSKFIKSSIRFPSTRQELENELKALQSNDKDETNLPKGEQPNEFAKYLFDEFLDGMDPWLNHELATLTNTNAIQTSTSSKNKSSLMNVLNPLRIHYILNDIENDRKRIIRHAIESLKNFKETE